MCKWTVHCTVDNCILNDVKSSEGLIQYTDTLKGYYTIPVDKKYSNGQFCFTLLLYRYYSKLNTVHSNYCVIFNTYIFFPVNKHTDFFFSYLPVAAS